MSDEDIFSRQLKLCPPDEMSKRFLFIGCGSVGSISALVVTKMGAIEIKLVDGDGIEIHNVANQFFARDRVGEKKADALQTDLERYTPRSGILVDAYNEFFTPNNAVDLLDSIDVVVVTVDSLEVRKMIFGELRSSGVKWLIDGRTARNFARVYTIDLKNDADCLLYEKSLEGKPSEIPCTERSVMYNVAVVAGLIGAQIRRVTLYPSDYHREILVDLEEIRLFTPS